MLHFLHFFAHNFLFLQLLVFPALSALTHSYTFFMLSQYRSCGVRVLVFSRKTTWVCFMFLPHVVRTLFETSPYFARTLPSHAHAPCRPGVGEVWALRGQHVGTAKQQVGKRRLPLHTAYCLLPTFFLFVLIPADLFF
jgi:hypothetical protein